MKNINLNRLLIITLVTVFSGMTFAFADGSRQEENKQREKEDGYHLQDIDINDVFCLGMFH